MILIGQFDSPFVRRVGIALRFYGMPFEHRPWSTFGDAEKIRPFNPLTRVPTLVLDDGTPLIDSHAIVDYLDGLVAPDRAMFPRAEPARHRALRIAALGAGLADKVVSLFYEVRLHAAVSDIWIARCRAQIAATLDVLERERVAARTPFWFGDAIGHADVMVACALRFLNEAHPGLVDMVAYPALAALSARLEAMAVFQEIRQPFAPPPG